jgi:hypothetical protein
MLLAHRDDGGPGAALIRTVVLEMDGVISTTMRRA